MKKLTFAHVFALWLLFAGCSSHSLPDSATKLSDLDRKIDQILAKLNSAPQAQPVAPPTGPGAELKQLSAKIDLLVSRMPAPREPSAIDPSKLKRESTTDLAWLLITNDPKEKASLVNRRIQQASVYKQLSTANIQAAVAELEGLNIVLNAPDRRTVINDRRKNGTQT